MTEIFPVIILIYGLVIGYRKQAEEISNIVEESEEFKIKEYEVWLKVVLRGNEFDPNSTLRT